MLNFARTIGAGSVLSLLSIAVPPAAFAGPAADTVRAMYLPEVQSALDEGLRSRFVDPARAQLDRNDALAAATESVGCIDWDLASDSQDYDQAEIQRTLKLDETVNGDTAEVTARFKVFTGGDESRIVWNLRRVGSAWKIADIASLTSDWRLSELDCTDSGDNAEDGADEGEGAN